MRERTEILEEVQDEIDYFYNGSNLLGLNQTMSSGFKTCVDTVVPDHAMRIRRGEIINNPCTIQHHLFELGQSKYTFARSYEPECDLEDNDIITGGTTGGSAFAWLIGFSGVPGQTELEHLSGITNEDEDTLISHAKQSAVADIDSTPYEFAEDLAEMRQNLRFIVKTAKDIAKIGKVFARKEDELRINYTWKGDTSPLALSDEISDLWLQYRFAISPAVKSITDLADSMLPDHAPDKVSPRRTSRGFKSSQKQSDLRTNETEPNKFNYSVVTKDAVNVHAGILYEVSNPLMDLRYRYGLRNKDILPTLWAVAPYSFMVDRLLDISKLIKGIINLTDPDISILAAWVRVKRDTVTELRYINRISAPDPCFTQYSLSGDPVRVTDFMYTRTPWKPTLYDTIPTFDLDRLIKDATSITDIITLAYNYVRKGSRSNKPKELI